MMDEQKRQSALVFERLYNQNELDLAESLFHPEYAQKPIGYSGLAGIRRHVGELRAGFPDLRCELIDQIGENDGVVNLVLLTGTHTGTLYEHIPPTGRAVMVMTIIIHRFVNGLIVEGVVSMDQLSMFQQLGVVPRPAWEGTGGG